MSDPSTTTPTTAGAAPAVDRSKDNVTPITKASQTGKAAKPAGKAAKAPAKAATKATKTKAAKAPAKKAASGTGVVRSASAVSKEGTKKDEHTGEVLPVTQFPTVRQADGTYVRGPVARKNLEAWRAAKKAKREAEKAAKNAEKAAKAAADAKAKQEAAAAGK